MDGVSIGISGDRQAGLRFDRFPDDLYDDFKSEIGQLTAELYSRVQAVTPSKTGRMRSQERERVFAEKDRIAGYVSVAGASGSQDFAKAAANEYGAHRRHEVKEHRMRLDHFWEEKLKAPITVLVSAFSRTPNIAEVSFLRGPLASMRSEVNARLNAVVEKAVAEANA